VQLAEVVTPPPAETQVAEAAPAPVEIPASLPHTASPFPLIGLVGLISLSLAFVFRAGIKRLHR
jgi:hypothetical protein